LKSLKKWSVRKRKAREAILDAENVVTSICRDGAELLGKASVSKKTKKISFELISFHV
jgi:hypothetical protein